MDTSLVAPTIPTAVVEYTLEQNPAAVYLAGLSRGSRPTMIGALVKIASLLTNGKTDYLSVNWAALRFQHTSAIRSRLAEEYSAATANRMLSALRGVLKAAWRLGQMSADDYQRAVDIGRVLGETLPAGRALTGEEISALISACVRDKTPAGARDVAMIAMLRTTGLRRAELCALEMSDYNPADDTLVVHGKRNKERVAYITNGTKDALRDWLIVRGDKPGPIFCPVNRGKHVVIRQMHHGAISVFNMLRKRSIEAGVVNISPHDLRRTFATDMLDKGEDVLVVSGLLGHASLNTTKKYDRRGEGAKRKAVERISVPYQSRSTCADQHTCSEDSASVPDDSVC